MAVQLKQTPSELALNSPGFTPLAFANALRIGSSSFVYVAGLLRREPRIAVWSIETTPSRPATEPSIVGQAQLREVYRKRFESPNLHAEIVNRIVTGNKVIDHERVVGIKDTPIEAVAVYEVTGGLISSVWFFYP